MNIQHLTEDLKKKVIKHHECTCKMAHEDQCAWYYEITNGVHDWNGWTHQWFIKDFLKHNPA